MKRLAEMRAHGFAWDAPAQYAVYLSTPPDLREVHPAPDFFASLAGGKDELTAWRAELSDFAKVSGFLDWEKERAPEREAELASVRAAADGRELAAPLAAYLGAKPWASWTVAVSPFFPPGGGASWVLEEKPGLPDVIVVYGPSWSKGSHWRRSRPVPDSPAEFAAGAWPEAVFAMTYVLYEVCRPALKPVPDACAGLEGLVNPEDCVQQTVVRGVVARLIEGEFGAAAARAYRAHWPATPYQDKEDAALLAYEADRAAEPDLMAAAGRLFAPFQADGKAPTCRLIDHSRDAETVYSRRLRYYQEARR